MAAFPRFSVNSRLRTPLLAGDNRWGRIITEVEPLSGGALRVDSCSDPRKRDATHSRQWNRFSLRFVERAFRISS